MPGESFHTNPFNFPKKHAKHGSGSIPLVRGYILGRVISFPGCREVHAMIISALSGASWVIWSVGQRSFRVLGEPKLKVQYQV